MTNFSIPDARIKNSIQGLQSLLKMQVAGINFVSFILAQGCMHVHLLPPLTQASYAICIYGDNIYWWIQYCK